MDTLKITISKAVTKSQLSIMKMLLLGFMAGAFIAFGAQGSTMAAAGLLADTATYGLGRALSGVIFATGLMMVIIGGGELFTGNNLMIAAALDKKITWLSMLRNWLFVYAGNLIGALFIAVLLDYSGLFTASAGVVGIMTVKIGAGKTSLAFGKAFVLGILCNWLVCLAVWMAFGAENTAGKVLAILFPIWLFVTSGFEHSVANMYYIPAAIFAKADFGQAALDAGLSAAALDSLNWQGFFVNNLIPVTLGNIAGGAVFVGIIYYLCYRSRNDR